MGQDLEQISEYFQHPQAGTWNIVGVIFFFLLILLSLWLTLRNARWKRRARVLVRGKSSANKRKTPRLPIRIPVQLYTATGKKPHNSEVLDISPGGVKLLLFQDEGDFPPHSLARISAEQAPWKNFGVLNLEVLRVRAGPVRGTVVLQGRWKDVSKEKRKQLQRAILHRLR